MSVTILVGFTLIILVGVTAQWLAWRMHLPSILLLLISGFILGPVTGLIVPDTLMGGLLIPVIQMSVAIILFEGGLSLRFSDLKGAGSVVRHLIGVGVLITWFIATVGANELLGMSREIAPLFGAIIVVTGPTVIIPLIRHLRIQGQANAILKWEGILIDPVGVIFAVLIFEVIISGEFGAATTAVISSVLRTIFLGGLTGVGAAFLLIQLLKRYLIPDWLESPITLMLVLTSFIVANSFQTESGLLAVTVMGVVLANNKSVRIQRIIEFKENLQTLLIAGVFVLLGARLRLTDLEYINFNSMLFLGLMFFVARPLSVFVSSLESNLSFKEKLFLSFVAPRGIVAAAAASIFAIYLAQHGSQEASLLVPYTFIVIIFSVLFYGLLSMPIARLLGLSKPNPQGIIIMGAHRWGREFGKVLKDLGIKVLFVDTNYTNLRAARRAGLHSLRGSLMSESTMDQIDWGGYGRLFAVTSNDEANSLAALHCVETLGKASVYQLTPEEGEGAVSLKLKGRTLFSKELTFDYIQKAFDEGGRFKSVKLERDISIEEFTQSYGVPLLSISTNDVVTPFAEDLKLGLKSGGTVVYLAAPPK